MLGKFLLGFVAACAIAIGVYTFTRGGGEATNTHMAGNDFTKIDYGKRGDDPVYSEEIKRNTALTLQAQDKATRLEKELQLMKEDKERSDRQTQQLLSALDGLKSEISELKGGTNTEAGSEAAEELQQQLEDKFKTINENIAKLNTANAEKEAENRARIAELEAALSLQNNQATAQQTTPTISSGIIRPYGGGQAVVVEDKTSIGNKLGETFEGVGNYLGVNGGVQNNGRDKVPTFTQPTRKKEWETVFPVYTIPPNTVLADSTLITPIIGRVPLPGKAGKGTVTDPFFFKVEVGAENLAANGQKIPGVAKIIASGYSTGVREQTCVRGYIDSLTFIFIDGRIVTQGESSGEGSSNGEALGYLADQWGKPCIRGTYINNAKEYLMSRGMAAFVEAAAAGFAQSQIETKEDGNGNKQAVLNGNVWQYVLGQGISGSAGELAEYVRARTDDAFDVVYVEQAKPVQIWLNKMIPIDYDSNARKISYYDEPEQTNQYD